MSIVEEILTDEPTVTANTRARHLIEGCDYTVTALRALISAIRMMGDDADPTAALLETILPKLAELEAGQL